MVNSLDLIYFLYFYDHLSCLSLLEIINLVNLAKKSEIKSSFHYILIKTLNYGLYHVNRLALLLSNLHMEEVELFYQVRKVLLDQVFCQYILHIKALQIFYESPRFSVLDFLLSNYSVQARTCEQEQVVISELVWAQVTIF